MKTTGYIYVLIDPRDNAVRYVGQTRTTPGRRLSGHYDRPTNRDMGDWFVDMKAHNVKPFMYILERPLLAELDNREWYWIGALCTHKAKLLNRIEPSFRAMLEAQVPWNLKTDLFLVIPDPSLTPSDNS